MRLALLMCVPLMLSASATRAQQPAAVAFVGPILSTSGQGEAKITPDRASVMVNVQTRATTAAAAASENANRTKAVFDAMGKLGIPKEQVTTEGYSVYPEMQYSRDGGAPRVSGYVATNTVRVETKRTEQTGSIIDAALAAGSNLINGVSFYSSSIESARREAIAEAVASARADAEAMARAAGGTVGDLVELNTGGPTVPPRPMYDMVMAKGAVASAAAPTPVNPGQQTVTVYVTARWRFSPAR